MAKIIYEKPSNKLPRKNLLSRIWAGVWALLSFFVSIAGLSLYSWFWPTLSLSTLDSLNPQNPFYNMLELRNTAAIPVYKVQPNIDIIKLESSTLNVSNLGLNSASHNINKIGGNESYTFNKIWKVL